MKLFKILWFNLQWEDFKTFQLQDNQNKKQSCKYQKY